MKAKDVITNRICYGYCRLSDPVHRIRSYLSELYLYFKFPPGERFHLLRPYTGSKTGGFYEVLKGRKWWFRQNIGKTGTNQSLHMIHGAFGYNALRVNISFSI